jgi:hypothetical protein
LKLRKSRWPPRAFGKSSGLPSRGRSWSSASSANADAETAISVHVLWATVVGRVEGHADVPFDVARVAEVRRDLRPEPGADKDAPF